MGKYHQICSKGMETNVKPVFHIPIQLELCLQVDMLRRIQFSSCKLHDKFPLPFLCYSLSRVAHLSTMLLVGLCLQRALM